MKGEKTYRLRFLRRLWKEKGRTGSYPNRDETKINMADVKIERKWAAATETKQKGTDYMNKSILIQYADLRQEVSELRVMINKLEQQISRIEEEGSVKDCVKGGAGGIQNFRVEGFPMPEYYKKVKILKKMKLKLEVREIDLLEILSQVEEFIHSINESYMRRLISLRVVENMSWQQVANKLGGGNTADSVRMTFNRFME